MASDYFWLLVIFELVLGPWVVRGVARIFQRGAHTVSNIMVMAFSPRNIVGCFLKKRLTKGGGVTGTPGPPSLRPWLNGSVVCFVFSKKQLNQVNCTINHIVHGSPIKSRHSGSCVPRPGPKFRVVQCPHNLSAAGRFTDIMAWI